MDQNDIHILQKLQENARVANVDIARSLEMAPSAVLERIRKLETRGVIRGYEADIVPRTVGFGLTAFVFVRAQGTEGPERTSDALAAIPEVLEVHYVAGDDCLLVKLRVKDTDHLARVMREKIRTIPKIESTRTTIVLETVKETGRMPLDLVNLEERQ